MSANGPSNAELMTVLQKVLNQQQELTTEVERIAEVLKQQQNRKQYQSDYYKKRKAKKLAKEAENKRLPNPRGNCLHGGGRDRNLPVAEWAKTLKLFVERGLSAYNFMSWLAWTWNHNTYKVVPVTRSGGYLHLYYGMSDNKAMRTKRSERDFTGHMRINTFANKVQLETFRDASWWNWTWGVLSQVVNEVEDEPWYKALGDAWHRPMQVMQGGIGGYVIRGIAFDQNCNCLETATKQYALFRPTLEMGWGACMRGLFCKKEPFRVTST